MPLSDVAAVTISTTPTGPTQQGFGIPLILGACLNASWGTDKIRSYATLAGMVADGFLTTDPEYLAAQAMLSQKAPAPPPKFAIGKRTNKPTQKFTITVLQAVNGKVYTAKIGGVAKTFTAGGGDTTSTIATGLAAAIGTPTGFGAAAAVGPVITLTASVAGNWLRVEALGPNVDLDIQQTCVDAGIAADVTAIANVDSTWYGIMSIFTSNLEVAALAAWCETNGKSFVVATQDSTCLGSGTSDIASTLKTGAYSLTSCVYHQDNGLFADATWLGARLPTNPGSENWGFSPGVGLTPTVLTTTQQTNLDGKYCNYFYTVANLNYFWKGRAADGNFIDVRRGRDWTVARLQNRLLTLQVNLAAQGKKIPFTDGGIAMIESELRAQYSEAVAAGYIAPSPAPTYVIPKASAASAGDKSSRTLNGMTFSWPLAGAIDTVNLTGVVS